MSEWYGFHSPPFWINAPDEAGVYWIRDGEENVIYVGKADSILDRLARHLEDSSHCMHRYSGLAFSFLEIPNRTERDQREKSLIRRFRPPCNERIG